MEHATIFKKGSEQEIKNRKGRYLPRLEGEKWRRIIKRGPATKKKRRKKDQVEVAGQANVPY
jgi:hypothetical protein